MLSGVMAFREPTSSFSPQPPQPLPLVQPLTVGSSLSARAAVLFDSIQPRPNATARARIPPVHRRIRMVQTPSVLSTEYSELVMLRISPAAPRGPSPAASDTSPRTVRV